MRKLRMRLRRFRKSLLFDRSADARAVRKPLKLSWAVLLIVASLGGAGSRRQRAFAAESPMVKYIGMHPLSPHNGEYCYIDAVHYHRFVPVDLRVYTTVKETEKDKAQLYVGDPAWLGYDGPKVGYFGPHPLTVPLLTNAGPIFCYIAGPHYHASAPAASPQMVLKDGVYWYLGPPPPVDVPRTWVNEVHAIRSYEPPKVTLAAAPPGYHEFKPVEVVPPAKPGATVPAQPPSPAPKPSGSRGSR